MALGKVMGWKAGRCRQVQISELFSIEECEHAMMDFLVATEPGKFPAKRTTAWKRRRGQLRCGEAAAMGVSIRSLCSFVSFLFSLCSV